MIPITRPYIDEAEAAAAHETVLSGWITQGPKVKAFESLFAESVGSLYACAVANCTAALHLALKLVGVQPGDVVITVSHSFIATANAVRMCGAEPVFVDIEPQTYNMSTAELERCFKVDCKLRDGRLYYRFTDRIRTGESPLQLIDASYCGRVAAILPVHQMGSPCDLSSIVKLAKEYHLPVVEDAACAIGSEIRIENEWERIGKPHGDIACFSFHPRKIITTGDGGMLTTNNANYAEQAKLLRHHGMSISDGERHHTKRIVFESYLTTGFNYRLTDIQAAIGIQQLKKLENMINERKRIAGTYKAALHHINWLELPEDPPHGRNNWQSYPVRIKKTAPMERDAFMQYLMDKGISTRPGIMNAHTQPAYMTEIHLKHSEIARDSVVLLPLYNGMNDEAISTITDVIKNMAS